MFDDLMWDALLQAWPWFGAAAVVFVGAVGLFIALKPKPERQPDIAADTADKIGWTLTRRIDFADPQSVGALVLEVEEARSSMSPSGVEHREIRWRRATLPEAKMVLGSYHVRQNLAMSPSFTVSSPIETTQEEKGQGERVGTELKVAGNGHDMADVASSWGCRTTLSGFSRLSPSNISPAARRNEHDQSKRSYRYLSLGSVRCGNISTLAITSLTNFTSAGNRGNDSTMPHISSE